MADSAHRTPLEAAFEEVKKLPDVNQAEIARFLREYVEEQRAPSLLTEGQKAEVLRRLADPDAAYYTDEEVFDEIEKLLSEK